MGVEAIFQNPLYTGILGTIGGVVLALITKFGEGWIDEYYIDTRRKSDRKRKAAEDITSFVIYGMHNGFRWKAPSEKEVKIRAQEIKVIDVEVGKKLKEFLINWSMYRNITKDKTPEFIEAVNVRRFRDKAQSLGQELLDVAEEWAK